MIVGKHRRRIDGESTVLQPPGQTNVLAGVQSFSIACLGAAVCVACTADSGEALTGGTGVYPG